MPTKLGGSGGSPPLGNLWKFNDQKVQFWVKSEERNGPLSSTKNKYTLLSIGRKKTEKVSDTFFGHISLNYGPIFKI